ncbi:MAG: hypothetical protein U9O94_07940 [Nanoarchaeota archaeon]|nr:hypothetical protein [Nanoarchaeota archaeon]
MNQKSHRIIGLIGVPLVLFALQSILSFELNVFLVLSIGALVGVLFGGGIASPDFDKYVGAHRNFVSHSPLIPFIIFLFTRNISYLNLVVFSIFIVWSLHVLFDYFSEHDELAFEFDPSEWAWGKLSYFSSWIILLVSWGLILFKIV